jgi:hypothetical protein
VSLSWILWRLVTGSVPSRPLGVFRAAIGAAAVVKGFDLAAELADGQQIRWAEDWFATDM